MTTTAYKTSRRTIEVPKGPWPCPAGWRLVPDTATDEWIEGMKTRTSYPQTKRALEMMLETAPKYEDMK